MTTDILKRFSIESLIASRDVAVAKFREAARCIRDAERAADAWARLPSIASRDHYYSLYDEKADGLEPRLEKIIDRNYWQALMAQSGIRDGMSAEAMRKMTAQIESDQCPQLTEATVRATFQDLAARREEMFADFILSIYRRISWDHKTNRPAAFGKKMILGYAQSSWHSDRVDIAHDSVLLEVERAICMMCDISLRSHENDIARVLNQSWQYPDRGVGFGEWGESTTGKFRVKVFKNKNAHLVIDPDIVEQMNKIISDDLSLPWGRKT